MNCQQLLAFLSDYIDHDLSEDLASEIREHASTCHDCHVVLDTLNQTVILCHEAGKRGIPLDRRADLFARLQQALREGSDPSPAS